MSGVPRPDCHIMTELVWKLIDGIRMRCTPQRITNDIPFDWNGGMDHDDHVGQAFSAGQ